ncbi:MAG: type II secretion system protein [Patescibacteria group bacterium]
MFSKKLQVINCKPIKGFSIIELIVVISIIGIMSSLMFANYRQGERESTLEYATQQVAQDIRKAQNLSLAGSKLDEDYTYGYGIFFDKNKKSEYFIYGDVGEKNKYYKFNIENDKEIFSEPIVLSTNVEINITKNEDIFFAPPDPITYINGENDNNVKTEIKICFTTINKCKTILVTTAGRIEVSNNKN